MSEALSDRLRAAIELSGVGTALLDELGRATYINDSFSRIMGVQPEDTLARMFTDLVTPDDRDLNRVERDDGSGSRHSFSNEVRLDTRDGATRWVRAHRTRLAPIGGQIEYLVQIEDITGKREMEADLRRSEETSRVSLDALEQGVILAGATGVIQRINPAAERILGYTAEQLTDLWRGPDWVVYDESGAVLAPELRPIMRARATGEPVIGQTVGWVRSDGRRIMVRVSCLANADDAGGLVLAFADVTEEHRAQRLLDATFDTAPAGLAILDSDRRIIRCNAVFAQQAGHLPSDLVGMDVVGLIHPEDRPDAVTVGKGLRKGSSSDGQLEQRVVRPDGSVIWVKTHLAVIAGPDRPLAIAATFDVTQQRRMTQELSRYGYLFDHSNDLITIVDANGQVMSASPSGLQVLGYPHGYSHPDGILGLIHPDDVTKAAAQLTALIDNAAGTEPFTIRMCANDGGWRHMECVGVNLLDEPAVQGIVITARDITERERLIEELAHRASHDTLTDLPNRSVLDGLLTQLLAAAVRGGHHVGLCFVDLDDFKSVNDTLGHAAGDRLLVDIAGRIRSLLRPGDTAARIGGDEFVIVLDAVAGAPEALGVATRVRDAIVGADIAARAAAATGVRFGASVGLTLSRPGDTPTTILGRADAALYRAKARHDSSIELAAPTPG